MAPGERNRYWNVVRTNAHAVVAAPTAAEAARAVFGPGHRGVRVTPAGAVECINPLGGERVVVGRVSEAADYAPLQCVAPENPDCRCWCEGCPAHLGEV